MARTVNDTSEEASNLNLTMNTRKEEMIAKGFKEVRINNFANLIDSVTRKGSLQKAAHDTMIQNTESQNKFLEEGQTIIRKIQNAGRSAFGKNKTKLKEFRIGSNASKSVGKISPLLDHLAGVCTKYHDELVENGLTEEDIASITPAYANLVTADSIQEHSKKLRTVATQTRDEAVAALEEEMYRIRSFAKSAFAGNKGLLEEFKPIRKGGRPRGTNPTQSPDQPQPGK